MNESIIPLDETIDLSEAQRKLDAFLVENQELETLNARLAAFNLFSVLRAEKVEIRHSNVLAWLLNPEGSHGLGPVFLRRCLSRLLHEQNHPDVSITPSEFELMDFADLEVLREWQNIDVLVRSPSEQWCLLIENKIKSKESKGQLRRYMERAKQDIPDSQIIPVYLTLDGDDPSADGLEIGYMPVSYVQVLELAEQIITQHRSRMPQDAQTFLQHYLETLRRLTMQDQELIELCKSIYRKHRDAIDLIVEYGTVSNVREAYMAEIESLVDCEFIRQTRGGVWFLPRDVGDLMPTQEMSGWGFLPRSVPVVFWYYYKANRERLIFVIEVGPLSDSTKRIELLTAFRDAGLKMGDAGFRKEAKTSRISSVNQKLKVDSDGEPDVSDDSVRQTAAALWKKQQDSVAKVIDVLREFNWN